MPEYRRWYVPGGTFFFTVVTYRRRTILCSDVARRCLREAVEKVRTDWPFELAAVVLLPDHLHTVWTLPAGDDRYPIRWKRIKEEFTRRYLETGGKEIPAGHSRLRRCERGIWQRRYWEHTVRDEEDPICPYSVFGVTKRISTRRGSDQLRISFAFSSFPAFVIPFVWRPAKHHRPDPTEFAGSRRDHENAKERKPEDLAGSPSRPVDLRAVEQNSATIHHRVLSSPGRG